MDIFLAGHVSMGKSKRAREKDPEREESVVGGGEVEREPENELAGSPPPAKKAKKSEEYTLGNVISLLVEGNSLVAGDFTMLLYWRVLLTFPPGSGLTCFLKGVVQLEPAGDEDEVGGAMGAELLCGYLSQYPECQHLIQPLEWDRDKRTMDVVNLPFPYLQTKKITFLPFFSLCPDAFVLQMSRTSPAIHVSPSHHCDHAHLGQTLSHYRPQTGSKVTR